MISSLKVISALKRDGWRLKTVCGDHWQFVHPIKKGKVTVQHPKKDIPMWTLKSIEKQSGVKLR